MAIEQLYTTETPDPANVDLADLGAPGGSTSTTMVFAVDGSVLGIRFFAPVTVANGTVFTAELYECTGTDGVSGGTGTGTLLASKAVTQTGGAPITPAAWNVITFNTPVAVTGLTKAYRHTIHNNASRYVAIAGYFVTSHTNGNVTGIQSGTNPVGIGSLRNGTFKSSTGAGAYPNEFFNTPSYLIDTQFQAGSTSNDGTFSGNLPALTGAFSVDLPTNVTFSGNLPALTGAFSGDIRNDGNFASLLPALIGSFTSDEVMTAVLSGSLPALTGAFTSDADAAIPEASSAELRAQRALTSAFILANPSLITLYPRTRVRQANGGYRQARDAARSSQIMRVIEQAPPSVITLEDGTQRSLDYVLLAEWNATIAKGDVFDFAGDTCLVIDVYHNNGYEIRADVVRYLDPPVTV